MTMETYKVQPGDSLSKISQMKYGDFSMVNEIARLNNIANVNLIHPGQVLRLPTVQEAEVSVLDQNGNTISTNKKNWLPYLLVGLLAAGGIYYVVNRKKKGKKVISVNGLSGTKRKKSSLKKKVLDNSILYGLEFINEKGLNGLGATKDGQNKIYDMITDKIIQAIDKVDTSKGWEAPWYKVRSVEGQAVNFNTRKPYRGINFFLLNFIAPMFGNTSSYWLTFNQIKTLGGKLRKGAEGWPIIFYTVYHKGEDGKNISEAEYKKQITKYKGLKESEFTKLKSEGKQLPQELWTISYYSVFGDEDIEGIDFPNRAKGRATANQIETAEKIVAGMPNAPQINHHDLPKAHYQPKADVVTVPEMNLFKEDQGYYSTLFHELIHSTGHSSRLNRFEKKSHEGEDYAIEELVAELGASYLNAEAGILYFNVNHSADYLKRWKSRLKDALLDDNKLFMVASGQAQKAADFILDKVYEPKQSKDRSPKTFVKKSSKRKVKS